MKKILLAIAIGIVIFSSLVKADVYQYNIAAEIFNNNTIHYKISLILSNTSQDIAIPLGQPTNVQFNSSFCQVQYGSLETVVVCSVGKSYERPTVTIEYDSNSVKAKDNYFLFTDSFKMPDNTKTLSFLIKLSEGSGLKEPTESSYSPEGALISSDGRRPIINWVRNDLKSGDRFDVSIAFERIFQVSQFPFAIILVTILITFSILGLFYKFYWKARNVKLILPVLKKDEKTIFNTIMKHGSGVNQKIIVKDSGYSKAKVSKVLSSLKERGLIKLERIGRSNKVYIEKNFEKKS